MQRIIVAGLLPVQNQKVQQRYGRRAEIRFLTTDSSVNTWQKAAEGNYDKVFMNTKFISHKHQDAIPREKIIYVNGSLSSMCRELEKHLPLHGEPATLNDVQAYVKEHSAPKTNVMLDFARRNGLSTVEIPLSTPDIIPVAHKVYDLLSRRAVGSNLTPKDANKLLGLDPEFLTNVNTAMAKAVTRGYLTRLSAGIYVITDKTGKISELIGSRKTRQARGRAPESNPLENLEHGITTMMQAVEDLKKAPKFDITTVSDKELYGEIARRYMK